MKLILKRIERAVDASSIHDEEVFLDGRRIPGPFALCTEDGQVLPCQVSNALESDYTNIARLTVTFLVDGKSVVVEGDV